MSRFAIMPAAAVTDTRLTTRDLTVLAAIGVHTDRNGWCYPSQGRLGEMLGITRQAVQKSMRALTGAGYVQIVARVRGDGAQTSNAMRVLFDTEHPLEVMRTAPPATVEVAPPATPGVAPPATPEVAPPATPGVAPINDPSNDPVERKKPARGTRLPPDWWPNADLLAYAAERGWSGARLNDEIENFRDYWHAAPGSKGVKADWNATFRTWIRKARSYDRPQTTGRAGRESEAQRVERTNREHDRREGFSLGP